MPELPEVETVVRDLRPLLTGRKLASVRTSKQSLRRPWKKTWAQALRLQEIRSLRRRGKWIVLVLTQERHLVIHLGMTGQLTVVPREQAEQEHTHLVFELIEPGGEALHHLRFRDIRRFGSATLFESSVALEQFFEQSGLGPEPFDLDSGQWTQRLQATRRPLKAVLLDQRMVAGVGNIYADEALFEAQLHPARLATTLSPPTCELLRQGIVTVLTRAIERRGSTIRNYVGGSGLAGGYQDEFRAYGRTGLPCPRCQQPIARTRLAGRSTHYCPQCQSPGSE